MSSLWNKYNNLPLIGRLWIGGSTMAFAYGGMLLSDYLYEKQQNGLKDPAIDEVNRADDNNSATKPRISDISDNKSDKI
ncbi:hypothetical protein V1511DRAFT_511845 [Dipodascopsis uninucleata]